MKYKDAVEDLAEALDLPGEAMTGAVRIVLTGRRRAMVEHHRGLLGYTAESVEVSAPPGRIRILGRDLELRAMDADALLITGTLTAVEYD
jgi:sporulation protein YqfC